MAKEKVSASDTISLNKQVRRYQVLSSIINTVISRLQTAYQNQQLTKKNSKV